MEDFLWGFSIVSIVYVLRRLRKAMSKPPLSWVGQFLIDQPGEKATSASSESVIFSRENDQLPKGLPNFDVLINQGSNDDKATLIKSRKRPARLVLPETRPELDFGGMNNRELESREIEVEGRDFCLASKKGRRDVMEDGYSAIVDISGNPKQAFFAVIDGHGGCAAVDYVSENLGKNILKALENVGEEDVNEAIRGGYLVTDSEFLSKGVGSGACAASVFLRNGELNVANLGDCRVVLSRKGVAHTLTNDHSLRREDERLRIDNSGGFVCCRNGVWRIQGSLAVSRAIGDQHLKEWVISEPDIINFPLSSDCEFLIMASDGLWDKVSEQEAVDVVLGDDKNSVESCKKLVEISCSRGNMDDITVMVINLRNLI
ncbi:hypothetical protein HS088_TW10G00952 [Tripterygium wilfordii]|uniref:PPM-type phosphatase domain-containing protein n=1 Tax=Tripterygium wilfordii TaxID=458696 RepID=A0A7J7D6K1_TRIWF|nr:probable protein phosphatase 2C 77 [Tripterygium wilfordii]KAF5741944.1 hypothetical protein HS088_TW10G00952 [Tripterygium wilfordii]